MSPAMMAGKDKEECKEEKQKNENRKTESGNERKRRKKG